jgi:four helix bundle protein
MSEELEKRLLNFSLRIRDFCSSVKWDLINTPYIKQLLRSSSSVTANYVEASDDLGKADEKMKIKIARREAKESAVFLKLMSLYGDKALENERVFLLDEAGQIRKILSSIIIKLN